jgi:triacylglycerol lipase
MPELGATAALPYDPLKAAFYGQFVNAAYTMYDDQPTNPTPPPPKLPKTLPGNYRFVAWVQMRDFIFESGDWTFYGLIAQNPSGANDYVLAIRGTSDLTEWWDDLTSMVPWAWDAFGGDVGYGFFRIYQTLRIIYPLKGQALTEAAAAGQGESLEAAGSFADQVAEAVRRHAAESQPATAQAAAAPMSVTVAAHSLGSALATLYVADNSLTKKVKTPLLCTLASPRVGDYTFATTFDGLGIPSWRIVNELDIVPKLPIFPFWHIQTEAPLQFRIDDGVVVGMLAFHRYLSEPARPQAAVVAGLRLATEGGGSRSRVASRASEAGACRCRISGCAGKGRRDRGACRHHDQHHDQGRLSSRLSRCALGKQTIVHAAIACFAVLQPLVIGCAQRGVRLAVEKGQEGVAPPSRDRRDLMQRAA